MLRYAIALSVLLLSSLLREALHPWLTLDHGFILFLPGIILVTFVAGLGPGILITLMSTVVLWYFFLPMYYSFEINLGDAIGLTAFVLASGTGIALIHWLRITFVRLETLAKQREALFEADPNGILVVDAAGVIHLANSNLIKLFGYSKDELIGQSVEMLVPDHFRSNHPSLRTIFS